MIPSALTVSLVEIGPRTETGISSGAHRCLGADGRYSFVKSPKLAGAGAVVAEWLAAGLGDDMNLHVQEASLVSIPGQLITPDLQRLGDGTAFGSLELPHADTLTWAAAAGLPSALRAEVLLFDWWIHNADRTLGAAGGNPNLLAAAGRPLALIDHGNGFDLEFDPGSFLAHHAFADRWFDWLDKSRRAAWQKRVRRAVKNLPARWGLIPAEWHENDFGEIRHQMTLEKIQALLNRVHTDPTVFWSGLLTP